MLDHVVIPCNVSLTLIFFGLETIKEQYVHDAEFKDILQNCKEGRTWNKFVLNDGFVFRANKLSIPDSSVRLLLMHCHNVIPGYLNLTLRFLDWKPLKNSMCMMLNLKMYC